MLSGRQIHGLKVKNLSGSREFGRITDIVADTQSGIVSGYIISGSGLLAKNFFLPAANMLGMDLRGAVIANSGALLPISAASGGQRLLGLRGERLQNQSGADYGTVADIIIEDGRLSGVEISRGIVGDLLQRRQFLPWQQLLSARQAGEMENENMIRG